VVKAADNRITSAEYAIKVARARYYPSVSLNVGFGSAFSSVAPEFFPVLGSPNIDVPVEVGFLGSDPSQRVFRLQSIPAEFQENTYWNQLDFNLRRFVGVNVNVPIFNRFQIRNSVTRSKINLERAELGATNVRFQLRQAIEQAYWDARASGKAYDATLNAMEALEESFRNVQQRFDLGASNVVEYNQIRNDYARVQSDLIRAKYDYIFKLKVLDFYQGKPLTF
jgi:outer membrane protein